MELTTLEIGLIVSVSLNLFLLLILAMIVGSYIRCCANRDREYYEMSKTNKVAIDTTS
jgi:hypothetical protein